MTLQTLLNNPNRPEPWHDKRFEHTLHALREYGLNNTHDVLNFGGWSIFNTVLEDEVKCNVENTSHDLRVFQQLPHQYDFALMMEVIEHLSDEPNIERVADWTYTGAVNCLKTARSCCDKLFISTPNVCGLRSLINIIEHKHPHTFQPHTHEYAPLELQQLVESCGWKVERLWTVDSWGNHGLNGVQTRIAHRLLKVAGASTALRKDNIFIIATHK